MNSEEAAQRAAACWNACEGLDTKTVLTIAAFGGMSQDNAVSAIARQRDQLLAAVEQAFASLDQTDQSGDVGNWISEPVEILRAAIAAAKGGAA